MKSLTIVKNLMIKYLQTHRNHASIEKIIDLLENCITDIKAKKNLYLALLNKIHEYELIQAGMTSDIGILSPATFSEKAHPLKLPLIVIASLLVGAFFGILFVLAKKILFPPLPNPMN